MTAAGLRDGGDRGGDLGARWRSLRATRPGLRARDAAAELGVSEAELLATTVGDTAVRLDRDSASLLRALPAVGRAMALTRNEHAVIEVRGHYGGIDLAPHAGQVVGDRIDLRVFLDHWQVAFAVREPHPQRSGELRRSIHVFDGSGIAVHKIYLEPDGDVTAWDAIVAARSILPAPPLTIAPPPRRDAERADHEVDRAALLADWDAMMDTHQFFHLLRRHGVTRAQALRLAGSERARPVATAAFARALEAVSTSGASIMIFAGNRGCLQIYSGPVGRVVRTGPWLNVLDPEFNLHLREDSIAGAWIVRKPTQAGIVTSLELLDRAGQPIALLFRKREDRELAEDPAWSELLAAAAGA